MKTSKIASQYNLDQYDFDRFLDQNGYKVTEGIMSKVLDDSYDVSQVVNLYNADLAQRNANAAAEKAQQQKAEDEKQAAMAQMLITSGFNFDGYTITKYSGYISGDDVIQIARGSRGIFTSSTTDVGQALSESLVRIRRNALIELKEAAYALGCNAVVGVDFDYITLDPETASPQGGTVYLPYVFCVTANGNAVVIEKDE